jgi:hypothetical protein
MCMERKIFKSRLFSRKINPDNVDYWQLLYAEILFRLREIRELKCTCSSCISDSLRLENTLKQMVKEGHIKENPKPQSFTGKGDCGRRLGPVA